MGRRLQQSGKCFRRSDFESTVLGVYSTEYSPLPVRFFLCRGRSSGSYSVGFGRDSRSTACLYYSRNSWRDHVAGNLSVRAVPLAGGPLVALIGIYLFERLTKRPQVPGKEKPK